MCFNNDGNITRDDVVGSMASAYWLWLGRRSSREFPFVRPVFVS